MLGNAGEVYAISQHDPTFLERAPHDITISTCVKHSTDTGLRACSDRSGEMPEHVPGTAKLRLPTQHAFSGRT